MTTHLKLLGKPLWQGRQSGDNAAAFVALNQSLKFDQRLYPYDIEGSIAHVLMLGKQGILPQSEADSLVEILRNIRAELDAGTLIIDSTLEDIHSFVEAELTKRLGSIGKKVHTARSRNDQVALDLRLYTRDQVNQILAALSALQTALQEQADQHLQTTMPGYTHLQRAQPITFAQHLLAYHAMVSRDAERLTDSLKRINLSPLGAGALAGTTFPIDREWVAQYLNLDGILENTLDAVSDRDFVLEVLSVLSILMVHLSRFAEDIILWNSQEFNFITLDDAYTSGSSMMPQKKNPDAAELIRGKTGRVCGSLITLLTVMKGLPLAYNKDLQEDKEALFDAVDTVLLCLPALTGLVQTMGAKPEIMKAATATGFLNATALANYLVQKGLPFRDAYKLVGQWVQHCIDNQQKLEDLPLETFQADAPEVQQDVYASLSLNAACSPIKV